MKKRFLFTGLLLLFILIFTGIYSATVMLNDANFQKTQVRFTVMDIESGKPVHNACVCIPEADTYCYTDNNGNTPFVEVPIPRNPMYDDICKKEFGEITVIVYKEGFADYILLNFVVKENEVRQGVKLLLYKQNEETGIVSIVETPDTKWIESIIEKYRK